MPLSKGKSSQTVSKNISKMMHEWQAEGHIGTSKPRSKKQAVKQAVAIALTKAGLSRKQNSSQKKH